MTDRARVVHLLLQLLDAQKGARLGQLVCAAFGDPAMNGSQLYYCPDDRLAERLETLLARASYTPASLAELVQKLEA